MYVCMYIYIYINIYIYIYIYISVDNQLRVSSDLKMMIKENKQ